MIKVSGREQTYSWTATKLISISHNRSFWTGSRSHRSYWKMSKQTQWVSMGTGEAEVRGIVLMLAD